jgi:zinc protease
LFLNLREKHVWTYGAYAVIKEDELIGSFTAYLKCRNIVSDSAVGELVHEMTRLREEKVTPADVQSNIVYMSGSFAIGLEDPARIAQFAINIERYHMPKDYYQNYLKNLAAVTAEDVQAIADKYITPANANIVVVGSKTDVAPKLEKYGPVSYYDNYGHPIKADQRVPAPAGMTAADVYKMYIKSIGGEVAVNNIKDIKTVSTSTVQGIPITITEMKKAPNKLKTEITGSTQGQTMVLQKQVYDGQKGYQEQQGRKAKMGADDIAEAAMEADIASDLHPEKYGITRALLGMEQLNGANVYVVEATKGGKKTTEYYDVQKGYLVKKIEAIETPQGPISKTEEFSDYKEVPAGKGYQVPYTMKQSSGAMVLTAKVQSVEINKGLADVDFKADIEIK